MEDETKDDFMDLLSLTDEEDGTTTPEEEEELEVLEIDEDSIAEVAVKELIKTIGLNNEVLEEVRDSVVMGGDSEFAEAFARISKSNSDAIKIISEFALQKERLRNQREIKKMDIEGKKEVNEHKSQLESGKTVNNNVLVMNRDDIFNQLFDESAKEKNITPPVKEIDAKEE